MPSPAKFMWVGVVLGASYLAKQKLLDEWEEASETGDNALTHESASYLLAASTPWDIVVTPWTEERSALVGDEKDKLRLISAGLIATILLT